MLIENNTIYNEEIITDGSKVLTKKYKIIVTAGIVLLIAMALYYSVKYGIKNGLTVIVIPIIGAIAIGVIGYLRIKSYRKMLLQRLRVVNHTDCPKVKYKIDDEKIVSETENGITTLYNKDIKRIIETDIQYVIIYLGNAFVFVSKNGFDDTGENTFKEKIL